MGINKHGMAAFLSLGLVSGCSVFSSSLYFPVDAGNIEAGRQAFIDHQCHACHSVAGERMPDLAGASAPMLELGGEIVQVKSYGELITSVINPGHAISASYREQQALESRVPVESPMPTPDLDRMTVMQLIDIVAFLDSRYQLVEGYESQSD